jgi:aldehyde:ferredoxin oxidoreductase
VAKYGSNALFETVYKFGDIPIMNYTKGLLPGCEKLFSRNYIDNMLVRDTSCWGCTVSHNKVIRLKGGVYEGREIEMPEYEIVAAWGSMIGVTDPTVPPVLGELCDRLGLDSLACGNAVAFAMECFEKGIITRDDTEGLELKFGNHDAAYQIIEKIAKRQGFGALLADGALWAAERIGKGSEKFVVHVKNMALPMHDHRAFWGYALQYAVGSAGPVHEGGPIGLEMSGSLPRFSTKDKAQAVKQGQSLKLFGDNLGVCRYGTTGVPQDLMVRTLSAATGLQLTLSDAEQSVMRALNIKRAFNVRNGLTPEDDTLPHRYIADPPKEGGAQGSAVNIKPMVQDYYELMGWDKKTGKPYRKTLEALGLEKVAEDIW